MRQRYGIIFDCDGTLVDSLGYALESFNYALEKIGEAPRPVAEIKRWFGAGADRIFTNLLGGDEKKGLAAFEVYVDHQSELAHKMKLHEGVQALLDVAANAGIPMGVVTGRHARDLEAILKPHNIAEYFEVLIADNHLPKSKPAPDGILAALQRMGLEARNTLYVGDSPLDMQAAHAAGSLPVAALWDVLADPQVLEKEKPYTMAQTPAEVWTAFQKAFA